MTGRTSDTLALADELNDIRHKLAMVDFAVCGIASMGCPTDEVTSGIRDALVDVGQRLEAVRDGIHPEADDDKPAADLTPFLGSGSMRSALAEICAALELPETEIEEAMRSEEALIAFARQHNQSLDYIINGDAQPMIRRLARMRPAY